jgi:hypothetical protein
VVLHHPNQTCASDHVLYRRSYWSLPHRVSGFGSSINRPTLSQIRWDS